MFSVLCCISGNDFTEHSFFSDLTVLHRPELAIALPIPFQNPSQSLPYSLALCKLVCYFSFYNHKFGTTVTLMY